MDGFFKLQGVGGPNQIPDKFTTSESPKYKFLFWTKFKFRTESPTHQGTGNVETNAFAIKQMGRPNPIITYQDANYYGYRTKVATKTDFATFNMSFYDDSANRAHDLFEKYMQAVSPITQIGNANNLFGSQTIGELPNDARLGPIEEIELFHGYKGPNKTTYKFMNPRITNIMLDELDMLGSEVASVNLTFVYDSFHVSRDR